MRIHYKMNSQPVKKPPIPTQQNRRDVATSSDEKNAVEHSPELNKDVSENNIGAPPSASPIHPQHPPMPLPSEYVDADATAISVTSESAELKQYKHFGFKEIDDELDQTFGLEHTNDSTILDIIVVYVKGQKILYTEAKTLCEQRLNALMIPAIFNTAVCTILSLVLKDISFGATIVSVLNGINALFLALINYLKLDARAEAHRTAAYKFDKLQSYLEFNSGKVLFTLPKEENKAEYDIYQIMKIAEKEIREIKDTNQFILPERIRFKFPTLYSTNVFSIVKEYMNDDMLLVNKFKDLLNSKQDILKELAEYSSVTVSDARGSKDKKRDDLEKQYAFINNECRDMLNKIIEKKKEYLKIDDSYQTEVDKYIKMSRIGLCDWLKS